MEQKKSNMQKTSIDKLKSYNNLLVTKSGQELLDLET